MKKCKGIQTERMISGDFVSYFSAFLTHNKIEFQLRDSCVFESGKIEVKYLETIPEDYKFIEKPINVWKDQWFKYPEIVLSRLSSVLGLNQKLPARVCNVRRVNQHIAEDFLNQNHLQQSIGAKLKYGLYLPKAYFRLLPEEFKPDSDELLLAVMTFSGAKKYYLEEKIVLSFELIRFANLNGFNVVGGFSKMLGYFVKEKTPGNIMTYIDADWSDGENFSKLGFELVEKTSPLYFVLDENKNRIKVRDRVEAEIINSGSYKYILSEF
ncbi:hypothetical protein [Lacihabitans sp. CCS-44]|uniref:hypothetical protein n=1 Tax=Lacihabitans sp. CCS-44 TaxID=2487331 RepID=UPI0020CF1DF1|nr:hypothetical protein [Lacihabitans sp. CCS-44]